LYYDIKPIDRDQKSGDRTLNSGLLPYPTGGIEGKIFK